MILHRCGIFAKYNANVNCALAQKCVANENLKVRICKRDERASRATRKYGVFLAGVENIGLTPICGSIVEILNRARLGGDNFTHKDTYLQEI